MEWNMRGGSLWVLKRFVVLILMKSVGETNVNVKLYYVSARRKSVTITIEP